MSPRESPLRIIQLRRVLYFLSLVVLVTSLIDLFVNRLLFRAGPEVLSHISFSIAFYSASVGRISITLGQILLFVVLAFAAILLLHEEQYLPRALGNLLIVIVVCSALLYVPLDPVQAWAVSTLLVLVAAITVSALAYMGAANQRGLPKRQRLARAGFLACLVLSFIFPLYYRMYLLLGAAGLASLPLPMGAYKAGLYSVMATSLAAFAYALHAPSPGFALRYRNFVKAAVLPTLLVVPMLYEVMRSFFVSQILAMVVAMSTDFVLSLDLLRALIVFGWFFLTAVLILLLKGHYSGNRLLRYEGVGLILIMSTTFLFNYPYYIMLGTAGVFLLCYPLLRTDEETCMQVAQR